MHCLTMCRVSLILCLFALVSSEPVKFSVSEELAGAVISKTSTVPPIDDWIMQFGYPCENHEIQTEDGYLLTYHRIPYGKDQSADTVRTPVLVMHGVGSASPTWVAINESLGFLLADAGYDVWLGNARGVQYSRKHITLDPDTDKKKFWDFSWHEMGYYDLPAAINYILDVTNQTQLFYAGHSMGTTQYFVLGATRPEYMDKVKAAVLMAPVAYLRQDPSPVWRIGHMFRKFLAMLYKTTGTYEILAYTPRVHALVDIFCGDGPLQILCRTALFSVVGRDEEEFDRSMITTYLQYLPGGTSSKAFEHYGQIIKKDFSMFDYGILGNIKRYHSVKPHLYDLGKVSSPVYIHYAPNDETIVPEDALYTASLLPDVRNVTEVPFPSFNHADFMWGKHVKTLVYDVIIEQLLNHQ